MSEELTPLPQPVPDEPRDSGHRRPGLGPALLIILLTTLPLIGLLYLGYRLLRLPFVPFDLYDLLVRTGVSPWIALIDVLNGSQAAAGGNIAQSAPLVQWLLSLGLFILLALAIGLSFYAFVLRRGRRPDRIDGLVVAAILAVPMIFVSLSTSLSPLPALLNTIWLGALFIAWGIALTYALGRLMTPAGPTRVGEPAEGGIGRRQFLLQFGAGAAAITALSAAGAALAPGKDSAQLQTTLPMASPEFLDAQRELFGNFRRFVIVRGNTESAADSNVVALGAEYPDRNYVSVWLGGRSPIVIYESLQTALAAFAGEEEDAGIYWLDS
ncbi:MAG: hypothetical protein KA586_03130 [Candidatus Promineofilum sp.]|nr:hypothetical protein [Promineifilum sp.]